MTHFSWILCYMWHRHALYFDNTPCCHLCHERAFWYVAYSVYTNFCLSSLYDVKPMKMKYYNLYNILNCLSAIILIYLDNTYIEWLLFFSLMLDCPMFSFSSPFSPHFGLARLPNQLLRALDSTEQGLFYPAPPTSPPGQYTVLHSTLWNESSTHHIHPLSLALLSRRNLPLLPGPSNLPAWTVNYKMNLTPVQSPLDSREQ